MELIEDISASLFEQIPFIYDVSIDHKKLKEFNDELDRYSSYNKLCKLFNKDIKKAILLESGIFEFTIIYSITNNVGTDFIGSVYENKLQEMIDSLDKTSDRKNTYMIQNIKKNKVNIQQIPLLHYTDLDKPNWKTIVSKIELKDHMKNNIATTDLYKCGKCKESKCKVIQMQTRGADEMTSNIVTCLVCGNGWIN